MTAKNEGDIYWHRELPFEDAEQVQECVVEATSGPFLARLRITTNCGTSAMKI